MDIEYSAFEKLRDCVSTLKLLHGRTDWLDTENSSVGQITNKTPGDLTNVGVHIKDNAQISRSHDALNVIPPKRASGIMGEVRTVWIPLLTRSPTK